MTNRLAQLRKVQILRESSTGAAGDGAKVRILDVDTAEVSLPDAKVKVGIERGLDDQDASGWIIYPSEITDWSDGSSVTDDERLEIARILRSALEAIGYVVWDDD